MSAFPVTITSEALVQVKRLVARKSAEGSLLRIGVKGGGCSGFEYMFRMESSPRPDDLICEIDGVQVICDPKSATYLDGAVLVATGNLLGGGLAFENPNAARSCGCGTSFTPRGL